MMTVGKHGAWRKLLPGPVSSHERTSWWRELGWELTISPGGTSSPVFFLHSPCISCKALPLTLCPSLWQSPRQSLSEDVCLPRVQPELKHHFLDCVSLWNMSLPGLHHFLESSISRGPWDQQLPYLILSLSPIGGLEVTLMTFSRD